MRKIPSIAIFYLFFLNLYLHKNGVSSKGVLPQETSSLRHGFKNSKSNAASNENILKKKNGNLKHPHGYVRLAQGVVPGSAAGRSQEGSGSRTGVVASSVSTAPAEQNKESFNLIGSLFKLLYRNILKPMVQAVAGIEEEEPPKNLDVHRSGVEIKDETRDKTLLLEHNKGAEKTITDRKEDTKTEKDDDGEEEDLGGEGRNTNVTQQGLQDDETQDNAENFDDDSINIVDNTIHYAYMQDYTNTNNDTDGVEKFVQTMANLLPADDDVTEMLNGLSNDIIQYIQN
ncbi:hypothetical protein POCGH01_06028500 [Plasmodium ovale]|uniref:Merozoite surface protein n=2 Tax=Plasmodium ovale TaxID=36330 RepID=A0A1A8WQI2_PLAOA|nr:hypothetical protein POVCU2_0088980 [Plasmodium ovale curtisi]SBT01283.1 hypothetical protein POVCU1_065730 [Plasmodium ovale curtisi]SCP03985.1 hypothetical protein POCGH01_06028500 [Plasmodium ovale]